jgi:hypothetical protein
MPSTTATDRPADAIAVAQQYYRRSRPLTYLFALTVVGIVATGIVLLPFLGWVGLTLVVATAVRLPVFTTSGTVQLETTKPPATVREAFTGPFPPVLTFQWGLTDAVEATEGGGRYEISYLFGLRSVTMTAECDSTPDAEDTDLELVVTANGSPWARYQITIHDGPERTPDGLTIVEIDVDADRRFGLRRLPQWLVANRYRDAALDAQGYTVRERETNIAVF